MSETRPTNEASASETKSFGARRPRVGVTMGDPAGIGPEVVLKAAAEPEVERACQPVIIGNAHLLAETARKLNLHGEYRIIAHGDDLSDESTRNGAPLIFHLDNIRGEIEPGVESAEAGRAAAEYIEKAVELCLAKKLDAISTAPINKRSLYLGGYNFPGHTEFLAHLSGVSESVMAFVAGNLRIALISTHVPLVEALQLIKRERIARIAQLVARELKRWGIARPRLAIAAVNPHGGESGLFGTEEMLEISPAIEECRARGDFEIAGPFSADTIFLRAARGEFDIVIACYHDQAMIPVKCLSFGEAVNVTLGLPFVRTSVDHGTAFDIAGKGLAQHSSMVAAVKLAAELAARVGREDRSGAQAANVK